MSAATVHGFPPRVDEALAVEDADVLAIQMFDAALTAAGITSKEAAAYLIGCSESMVRKMRSTECRGRVTLAQMLRLPPAFHLALWRLMNRRYGLGRDALAVWWKRLAIWRWRWSDTGW